MSCMTLVLAATLFASTMHDDVPDPPSAGLPAHLRCAQVRPGMNYRDALALLGRAPDSTLSGHTAAGPSGEPPGSYAIDFWYDTDGEGRRMVSTLRYQGGTIDSVDCGRPVEDHATPPASTAAPGT
jgi:hypothetical protein